jgi:hypothetical protein
VNSEQIFGLIMVAILGVILPVGLAVGIPLGKAWARRLERGREQDDSETLAELDRVKGRLAELEERLDFTERVLSQQRETGRLAAGELGA